MVFPCKIRVFLCTVRAVCPPLFRAVISFETTITEFIFHTEGFALFAVFLMVFFLTFPLAWVNLYNVGSGHFVNYFQNGILRVSPLCRLSGYGYIKVFMSSASSSASINLFLLIAARLHFVQYYPVKRLTAAAAEGLVFKDPLLVAGVHVCELTSAFGAV